MVPKIYSCSVLFLISRNNNYILWWEYPTFSHDEIFPGNIHRIISTFWYICQTVPRLTNIKEIPIFWNLWRLWIYFRITKKHMKFVLIRIKQESESLENLEKCKIKTANFWVTLLSLILHFSFPIGFAHHNFFPKFDKLHGGWKVILCQLVKPSSWNMVYFFPFRLTVDLPYPHLLWWF